MARVLIVEDDPAIRRILMDALEDAGHHVRQTYDGALALAMMTAQLPDVILLDLMMPNMSGDVFATMCRGNADFAKVPIIVVSAAPQARAEAERIGAAAVVSKPFDVEQVLRLVEGVVRRP